MKPVCENNKTVFHKMFSERRIAKKVLLITLFAANILISFSLSNDI